MKLKYVLDILDKSINNLGTIDLNGVTKPTELDRKKLIYTYNLLFDLKKEIIKEAKKQKKISKGKKTNDRDK